MIVYEGGTLLPFMFVYGACEVGGALVAFTYVHGTYREGVH